LKGSIGKGIFLSSSSTIHLQGYCDSNCIFLGSNLISWKTKKQATVSWSSVEAEYRAMATLTFELQWLKYLLCDAGISHSSPITMFCDNQATLHIANNPVFYERTKYIEIGCHFIWKKLQSKLIAPRYILASNRIIKKASSVEISLTSAGLWWCFTKGSALFAHVPSPEMERKREDIPSSRFILSYLIALAEGQSTCKSQYTQSTHPFQIIDYLFNPSIENIYI
jgi:hypothetical protein